LQICITCKSLQYKLTLGKHRTSGAFKGADLRKEGHGGQRYGNGGLYGWSACAFGSWCRIMIGGPGEAGPPTMYHLLAQVNV
jgi:hypothetical protein